MKTLEGNAGGDPTFPLDLTNEGGMHPLLPDAEAMQSLVSENLRLRKLVVSLSATLLRNAAREAVSAPRRPNGSEVARPMHNAKNCICCAKLLHRKAEIAASLESAGHEFMAEPLQIEAQLQRAKRRTRTA